MEFTLLITIEIAIRENETHKTAVRILLVYLGFLCHTANYKLDALRRIRKYLSLEKAKLLCNAFINSQFNYAPLVWMFCRKTVFKDSKDSPQSTKGGI